MFDDITVETVKTEILNKITESAEAELDVREGSYTNNIISAVALAIYKVYQQFNKVKPIAFVDETSGEYLDRRAEEYGLSRKHGTKAITTLTFSGTAGTIIPAGTAFYNSDGLGYLSAEKVVLDESGTGNTEASAEDAGAQYNGYAGDINRMMQNISGLTAISNTPATGGTNEESSEDFYKRLQAFLKRRPSSGCVTDYEQWALSVEGVGAVKVIPLWNGNGTVKVIVCDGNLQPASEALIAAVKNYIETVRPIGAEVAVAAAVSLPVSVRVTVKLLPSVAADTVKTELKRRITEYFHEIAFASDTLYYNKIAYLLYGIDGVSDYENLLLNNATQNISIAVGSVLVLGEVAVYAD